MITHTPHDATAHGTMAHDDHGHDDHHAVEPPAAGSRAAELITTSLLIVSAVLSWITFVNVGFMHEDARIVLFPWITSGDLQVSWTLRVDTLTAVHARGGDDGVVARALLFDRLHGRGSEIGRGSSVISRCSPLRC